MIYLIRCSRCKEQWNLDTETASFKLEIGNCAFCPVCLHIVVFVGTGFRDFTKAEIENPANMGIMRCLRNEQEEKFLARGWYG